MTIPGHNSNDTDQVNEGGKKGPVQHGGSSSVLGSSMYLVRWIRILIDNVFPGE
jgi:hypothetical protein